MINIKEGVFKGHKGMAVKIVDDDKIERDAKVGELLKLLLEAYQASQHLTLTNKELRNRWKCLDVLEEGVDSKGYYNFEDADFEIMKKIVTTLTPFCAVKDLANNSPYLEELLQESEKASKEKAKESDTEVEDKKKLKMVKGSKK